jgi:hypothetical protein
MTDLFEALELLPVEVQQLIEDSNIDEGGCSYRECDQLLAALEPLGYTFEYGLDGIPYDLTVRPTHG